MNFQFRKANKKIVLSIVSLCLISFILGAVFVYASTPSTTFTISSGIYPGAPSYTFWVNSGTYYAKNNYGVVSYSSTNCTFVIEAAINSQVSGSEGTLKFLQGNYPISRINFPAGSRRYVIEGEGRTTVLTAISGSTIMLQVSGIYELVFRDLKIDGANIAAYGIYADYTAYGHSSSMQLENVMITHCTRGIYNTYGSDMLLINCYLTNNNLWDLDLWNVKAENYGGIIDNITVADEVQFSSYGAGHRYLNIASSSGKTVLASNCWFDPTVADANVMLGSSGFARNVVLDNCHFDGGTAYYVKFANAITCELINPTFQAKIPDLSYYLYFSGSSNNNTISIQPDGINTAKIYGNSASQRWDGPMFHNRGTFTNKANGDTILHGLVGAPDIVLVSVENGFGYPITAGYYSAGATTFTLSLYNATNGVPLSGLNGSWDVYYIP